MRGTMATRDLQCEKCGSVFFQEAEFRQYRGSVYSSAPGGAMYALESENGPVRACVCLCGHPTLFRSGVRRAPADFRDSLVAALRRRATSAPEALQASLAEEFASTEGMAELKSKLARLQEIVQRCLTNLGSPAARPSPLAPGTVRTTGDAAGQARDRVKPPRSGGDRRRQST